jgi:hypothetical protein
MPLVDQQMMIGRRHIDAPAADRHSVLRMGSGQGTAGGQDLRQCAWPGTDVQHNEYRRGKVARQISNKSLKSVQTTRRSSHNNDIASTHKGKNSRERRLWRRDMKFVGACIAQAP